MSAKRKAPPRNLLSHFWREFLFTRPFLFETDAMPQDCATAMADQMHYTLDDIFKKSDHTQEVHVEYAPLADNYQFKIARKRGQSITSYATGTIHYDIHTNYTLLQGEARFGTWNYLEMLVPLALSVLWIALNLNGTTRVFGLFVFPIFVFSCWQIYADRNRIIIGLERMLRTLPSETEKAKLEESGATGTVPIFDDTTTDLRHVDY